MLTRARIEEIRASLQFPSKDIHALCDAALLGIAASVGRRSMADKRDAERYRHLRGGGVAIMGDESPATLPASLPAGFVMSAPVFRFGETLDAAIDAAMSAEKGGTDA